MEYVPLGVIRRIKAEALASAVSNTVLAGRHMLVDKHGTSVCFQVDSFEVTCTVCYKGMSPWTYVAKRWEQT